MPCKALNSRGEPCGAPPMRGSKYCWQHRREKYWIYRIYSDHPVLIPSLFTIIPALIFFIIQFQQAEYYGKRTASREESKHDIKALINDSTTLQNRNSDKILKNQEEILSLLRNPPNALIYENQKDTLTEKSKKYINNELSNKSKAELDSAITNNKKIVEEISSKSIIWDKIFPEAYGLFYIGYDNSLKLYGHTLDKNIKVNWNLFKITELTKTELIVHIPDISFDRNIKISGGTLGIIRKYSNLNSQINIMGGIGVNNKNIYLGIISDNENGIVGIIGIGPELNIRPNKPILDYNSLKMALETENINPPS